MMQAFKTTYMKKQILIMLLCITTAMQAAAQTGGISGTVLNEKKEPVVGAFVEVTKGGHKEMSTVTDQEGNYILKPLQPGKYDVIVKYARYKIVKTKDVMVYPDSNTIMNYQMELDPNFIERHDYSTGTTQDTTIDIIYSTDIDKMPTRTVAPSSSYEHRHDYGRSYGPLNSCGPRARKYKQNSLEKKKKKRWLFF
ncbi:hypothetical protein CAP35_12130 [Chitinophagaceae bacterium IBVUCB1]|nr:hypothetical protein CAP35_12130 [Chitinophagaceae bacterium IBVUCB1]